MYKFWFYIHILCHYRHGYSHITKPSEYGYSVVHFLKIIKLLARKYYVERNNISQGHLYTKSYVNMNTGPFSYKILLVFFFFHFPNKLLNDLVW